MSAAVDLKRLEGMEVKITKEEEDERICISVPRRIPGWITRRNAASDAEMDELVQGTGGERPR
jgi:hypothetical protein